MKNPEQLMIFLFPMITLGVFAGIIVGIWLLSLVAPGFSLIPAV